MKTSIIVCAIIPGTSDPEEKARIP